MRLRRAWYCVLTLDRRLLRNMDPAIAQEEEDLIS
jgi:hypothetical protein